MRELRPPRRLEVGQQVELAAVIRAMAAPACRHDTSGSPQPPSEREIRCAGTIRPPVAPHAMHARSATAARCWSVAAIDSVRCSGVVRRSGFRARGRARRRSDVRFIVTPFSAMSCVTRPLAVGRPAPASEVSPSPRTVCGSLRRQARVDRPAGDQRSRVARTEASRGRGGSAASESPRVSCRPDRPRRSSSLISGSATAAHDVHNGRICPTVRTVVEALSTDVLQGKESSSLRPSIAARIWEGL